LNLEKQKNVKTAIVKNLNLKLSKKHVTIINI